MLRLRNLYSESQATQLRREPNFWCRHLLRRIVFSALQEFGHTASALKTISNLRYPQSFGPARFPRSPSSAKNPVDD